MDQSYRFSIARLAPSGARGERLNIGIAVFHDDGLRMHLPPRLDKVRAISAALDTAAMQEIAESFELRDAELLAAGVSDITARLRIIANAGPVQFSDFGTFRCRSEAEYHMRISMLLNSMVQPEPALKVGRGKRSRLLTDLKRTLRSERVLAKPSETIFSHRIVTNFELADGLKADLALKNGVMHIVETVDVAADESTVRRSIADIAVSALVLEQARINYGTDGTKTRLVYKSSTNMEAAARTCLDAAEHQGAELYNWASASDQHKLISTLSALAVPVETAAARRNRLNREAHPRFRSL